MTTSLSKLFVGGLSWGTIDSVLFDEFAKYGPLDEAIVVRDKITGRSRGFGFVRFQNPEDAQRAKEATDGNPIDGRVVRVDFASEKRRPALGMSPYDSPFGGNLLQSNMNYMGAYPAQGHFMQPQSQVYGYPQYPQQNMGGMYPMHMQQLQYQQSMPMRSPGYPLQGLQQQQSPPMGFMPTEQYTNGVDGQ